MLEKLKKELKRLREEQEEERKEFEKDYFFTKEWDLLMAQKKNNKRKEE
jgi:hypothetical protein